MVDFEEMKQFETVKQHKTKKIARGGDKDIKIRPSNSHRNQLFAFSRKHCKNDLVFDWEQENCKRYGELPTIKQVKDGIVQAEIKFQK